MTKDPIWLTVFTALIGAGGLGYVADWVKQRRIERATPKPVREQVAAVAAMDSTLAVVTKARDELHEDLERQRGVVADERANAAVLRETLYRERADHARERHEWEQREARHLARIDRLETRVGQLMEEVRSLRADIVGGVDAPPREEDP